MGLKLLPCGTGPTGDKPACGGPAILNDGLPYVLGRVPEHFPFRYKCSNCKRTTSITVAEWNRLPDLTLEALRRLPGPGGRGEVDLSRLLTQDLEGAGLSPDQIETAAAVVGPDLHLLSGENRGEKPGQ